MDQMRIKSLVQNGEAYTIHVDRRHPLGAGSQGAVYPIPGTDLVVKVYSDAGMKRQLVPFVRHLLEKQIPQRHASLSGLPLNVFEDDTGQVGVIMHRLSGSSLEKTGYRPHRALSLDQQLKIAGDLAQAVSILHANDVVIADLAEANLIYDADRCQIALIDIDGGGILAGRHYRLKPSVWGHDRGSLMALELRDRGQLSDRASDNWSLSVLQHRFLTQPAGADPFFFGRDFRVLAGDTAWPPQPAEYPPPMQPFFKQHRLNLACLGPRLATSFKNTFSVVGRHNPEHRVPASRWAKDIRRAQRWVHVCQGCGQHYVAEQTRACPVCRHPVPHAMLYVQGRPTPIQRESLVTNWRHLGLGNSRRPVLRWERDHDSLLVHVLTGMLLVGARQRYRRVSEGDCYQLGPGQHRLQLRAGRHEADFRLFHPKANWSTPVAQIAH